MTYVNSHRQKTARLSHYLNLFRGQGWMVTLPRSTDTIHRMDSSPELLLNKHATNDGGHRSQPFWPFTTQPGPKSQTRTRTKGREPQGSKKDRKQQDEHKDCCKPTCAWHPSRSCEHIEGGSSRQSMEHHACQYRSADSAPTHARPDEQHAAARRHQHGQKQG